MKIIKVIYLFIAASICACAHQSAELPVDAAPHKASRDYEAIGDSTGIRPYAYGKRTLIKVDSGVSFPFNIKDEHGTAVNYRMQGGYYVLDKKLDSFTLYGSGRLVQFKRISPSKLDLSDDNVEVTAENDTNFPDADLITVNQHKSITAHPLYAFMYEQMQ